MPVGRPAEVWEDERHLDGAKSTYGLFGCGGITDDCADMRKYGGKRKNGMRGHVYQIWLHICLVELTPNRSQLSPVWPVWSMAA